MDWKERFNKKPKTDDEEKVRDRMERIFFENNFSLLRKLIEPCEDEQDALNKLIDFADGRVRTERLIAFVKRFWRQ